MNKRATPNLGRNREHWSKAEKKRVKKKKNPLNAEVYNVKVQKTSFFIMKWNVLYFLERNKSLCRVEQVFLEHHFFLNIWKHYLFPKKIFSYEVSSSCGKKSITAWQFKTTEQPCTNTELKKSHISKLCSCYSSSLVIQYSFLGRYLCAVNTTLYLLLEKDTEFFHPPFSIMLVKILSSISKNSFKQALPSTNSGKQSGREEERQYAMGGAAMQLKA